jgi:hypothetical protein
MHYIISHSFDKVVYELPRPGVLWTPIARSFVVQQKAGQPASLKLRRPVGDWYSDRPDRLMEVGGQGHVLDIDRMWPCGPDLTLTMPTPTGDTLWRYQLGMQEGHISTVYNARAQAALFPVGLGRYFAASADDYFEPRWKGTLRPPFAEMVVK